MKIAICGSMTFHTEMEKIGEQLRNSGHEVEVPPLRIAASTAPGGKMSIRSHIDNHGGIDAFPHGHPVWQEKADAIDDHFAKVARSDAILIANYPKHGIDGYIGGNTLMELAIARFFRKRIYILLPPSSQLLWKEEVLGMQPTIIDENLNKIV